MSLSPSSNLDLNRWFARPNPSARPGLRMFCFPHAGSGVAPYLPWAKLLPPEVELCAVRFPGRESRLREEPFTRLTDLATNLALVLHPLLDRPFAFFGHSLGALVAFETVRSLRRTDQPIPEWFFASGRSAPHAPSGESPIYHLPQSALVAEIERRYEAIPPAVLAEPDLLELLLPTLRADLQMIETYPYESEAPLACPISAFGGHEDRGVTVASLHDWHTQTSKGFRVEAFPGGHFYLQTERSALLRSIVGDLAPLLPHT